MINNTEQETISIIQLTQQSSLAYQKVLALVHAEDMLISVQLYKSLIKEFIDIYKKI